AFHVGRNIHVPVARKTRLMISNRTRQLQNPNSPMIALLSLASDEMECPALMNSFRPRPPRDGRTQSPANRRFLLWRKCRLDRSYRLRGDRGPRSPETAFQAHHFDAPDAAMSRTRPSTAA